MTATPTLRLENIHKQFHHTPVLSGIDLDVHQGDVVALIGASGSGKSTLLRCINLLEQLDDGQIWLSGDDISVPHINQDRVRSRIGVGLATKAHEYPDRLSGGQQQRVALVRAIATNPDLLLLDEITSALDPQLVGEVLDLVRTLAHEGTTIVMATHEMAFAREVADTVVFLDGGVVCESGSAAEVLDTPRQQRTKEFLHRFRGNLS
jgi:polar amino acid transport system ATP-binding protein